MRAEFCLKQSTRRQPGQRLHAGDNRRKSDETSKPRVPRVRSTARTASCGGFNRRRLDPSPRRVRSTSRLVPAAARQRCSFRRGVWLGRGYGSQYSPQEVALTRGCGHESERLRPAPTDRCRERCAPVRCARRPQDVRGGQQLPTSADAVSQAKAYRRSFTQVGARGRRSASTCSHPHRCGRRRQCRGTVGRLAVLPSASWRGAREERAEPEQQTPDHGDGGDVETSGPGKALAF